MNLCQFLHYLGSVYHLSQCLGRLKQSNTHWWVDLRLREGLPLFAAASLALAPAPARPLTFREVKLQRLTPNPVSLGSHRSLPLPLPARADPGRWLPAPLAG